MHMVLDRQEAEFETERHVIFHRLVNTSIDGLTQDLMRF